VTHSLSVRTEAAYALTQWQNVHAPHNPPAPSAAPSQDGSGAGGSVASTARANIYEWAAMEVLLGCVRGMFMETVRVSVAPKAAGASDAKTPSVPCYLPQPNCFEDNTKTVLRSALLVSLASIKAGNGSTPEEIIEEILNFAENNDNSPPTAQSQTGGDKAVPMAQVVTGRSYDDAMYCAVLLYCLSMTVTSSSDLLHRVIDCAKYYLDRERIVASSLYEVDTEKNKGLFKNEDDLLSACYGQSGRSGSSAIGKSAIVTAMALQCICNMEIQLDTAGSHEHSLGVGGGSLEGQASRRKYVVFNYKAYLHQSVGKGSSSQHVPIVRASALDCSVRLAFAKYTARSHEQVAGSQAQISQMQPQHAYRVKKSNVLSECIELTLQVISSDPSKYVRRCASLSLLLALQVSGYNITSGSYSHNIVSLIYIILRIGKALFRIAY
jgi:hypothetical protein